MPGLKFATDMNAESLYKLAFRRTQDAGYTVRAEGDRAFTATKGSAALSMLAITAYCRFRISVESYQDGNELVLERNSPHLLGGIGVARVNSNAAELLQILATEVTGQGGKVWGQKEF